MPVEGHLLKYVVYHEYKIYETIKQYVINRYPILGICLGMQLLVCTGYEQKTSGLFYKR